MPSSDALPTQTAPPDHPGGEQRELYGEHKTSLQPTAGFVLLKQVFETISDELEGRYREPWEADSVP